MKLTERPVVTVTALVTLAPGGEVAQARLIVGSVASTPFAADATSLLGPGDFATRAEACADQQPPRLHPPSPTAKPLPTTFAT